jgi:nitrogen regulatory protein PII
MKRVQAVIRPERLDPVQEALALAGFDGFMVLDVRGHGAEASPSGEWRGVPYSMSVKHKLMVDVLVEDDEVETAAKAIKMAASTGQAGDGLLFVMDVVAVAPLRD